MIRLRTSFLIVVFLLASAATEDPYCQQTGKRKVLVIGLDGTKGNVFDLAMEQGLTPNFKAIADAGRAAKCTSVKDKNCATAHSGNRFGSLFPATREEPSDWLWVTSPGWASVTTGVDNYRHLVKNNDISTQSNFVNTSRVYPTLFMRAKRSLGLRTAASGAPNFLSSGFFEWGIIDFECGLNDDGTPVVNPNVNSSCNLDYRAGQLESDNNRDNRTVEFARLHILDDELCADVVMAHFDQIDAAGHGCSGGFSHNKCYLKAIATADEQVGDLLDAISAAIIARSESWLVLVTSDHGGHGNSHDTQWLDDEVVPFIVGVFGEDVKFHELQFPVKQFDLAPTAMAWLGLSVDGLDGQVQGIPSPKTASL